MNRSPSEDEFLAGMRLRDTFEGWSAEEIERLPMSDFARLRERAGLPPVEVRAPASVPPAPAGTDPVAVAAGRQPEHSVENPGVDFQGMTLSEYARVRDQLGIGASRKEGRGIFDAASRQDQADGARAHAGRSAWSDANVERPPQLTGRHRQAPVHDSRTTAERFGSAGNYFSI